VGGFAVFGIVSFFLFLLVLVCIGGFGISLLTSFSRFKGFDFYIFKFLY